MIIILSCQPGVGLQVAVPPTCSVKFIDNKYCRNCSCCLVAVAQVHGRARTGKVKSYRFFTIP